MRLYFCPECRSTSASEDWCPSCGLLRNSQAKKYVEKLLETILSPDPTRVGMAIDVLTKWLHEPRTIVPLVLLLEGDVDSHRFVMAARGLGWLGDRAAIPALRLLLFDPAKPFMARVAAAQALGQLGGQTAKLALQQATTDERSSVAQAAVQALTDMARSKEITDENSRIK
jgi:hypothetical protein